MRKIAIFSGYFLPHLGGVERYTDKLCVELTKLGYRPIIITSNYDNLDDIEEKQNYKIYRLPIYNIAKERYPIIKRNAKYKELMREIEEENIETAVINTRFYILSSIAAKFTKKHNIPNCIIEHGTDHFTFNNKIIDFIGEIYEHLLTHNIKRYVTDFYGVSNGCVNWLKHFKINAKGIFYNSIDSNEYEIYKEKEYIIEKCKDDTIISYASRLIKEKGIINLINAYNNIKKKFNNVKLIVAGDGPLLETLKEDYSNNTDIIFTGKLSHEDVMSLYNITDIFVHPSMYPEGLPTSILEAGLMKCAIIATNRGGTIEVIRDNIDGLIVEENTEDLIIKLEKLIQDKEFMNKCKNNIYNKVISDFSWESNAKKIIDKLNFSNQLKEI